MNNKYNKIFIISIVVIIIICIATYFILDNTMDGFAIGDNVINKYTITNGIDTYQIGDIDTTTNSFSLSSSKTINSSQMMTTTQDYVYAMLNINTINTPYSLEVSQTNVLTNTLITKTLLQFPGPNITISNIIAFCADINQYIYILLFNSITKKISIYQWNFTNATLMSTVDILATTTTSITDMQNYSFHIQIINNIKYLNISCSYKDNNILQNLVRQYTFTIDNKLEQIAFTTPNTNTLQKMSIYIKNVNKYYISGYANSTYYVLSYPMNTEYQNYNNVTIRFSSKIYGTGNTKLCFILNTDTLVFNVNGDYYTLEETDVYKSINLLNGPPTSLKTTFSNQYVLPSESTSTSTSTSTTTTTTPTTTTTQPITTMPTTTQPITTMPTTTMPTTTMPTTTMPTTTTTSYIDIQKKELDKAYNFMNNIRFTKLDNQNKLDKLNTRVNTLLTKLNTKNVAYATPDTNPMVFY